MPDERVQLIVLLYRSVLVVFVVQECVLVVQSLCTAAVSAWIRLLEWLIQHGEKNVLKIN